MESSGLIRTITSPSSYAATLSDVEIDSGNRSKVGRMARFARLIGSCSKPLRVINIHWPSFRCQNSSPNGNGSSGIGADDLGKRLSKLIYNREKKLEVLNLFQMIEFLISLDPREVRQKSQIEDAAEIRISGQWNC